MTDVRILAEVSADVANAANWYDREGYPGLGDKFETTFYFCSRAQEIHFSHRPTAASAGA